MSTESYRVVRADGAAALWNGNGTYSEDQAREVCCLLNANGAYGNGPYRVQRVVTTYEDVPDPEPMPELPEKVWWTQIARGGPVPVAASSVGKFVSDPAWRVFEGTVTDWREVER